MRGTHSLGDKHRNPAPPDQTHLTVTALRSKSPRTGLVPSPRLRGEG